MVGPLQALHKNLLDLRFVGPVSGQEEARAQVFQDLIDLGHQAIDRNTAGHMSGAFCTVAHLPPPAISLEEGETRFWPPVSGTAL